MLEKVDFILKRLDSRRLSELWLFYRDYFADDSECIAFLYDALKKEPEQSSIVLDDNLQSNVDDTVFIPRRMINTVERLVAAARDMDIIRRGEDIFKIIYIVSCVETLQNFLGNDTTKFKKLFDFFENFTSDDDKNFIASHFVYAEKPYEQLYDDVVVKTGDTDEVIKTYDCFKCFVGAINWYRNSAVHEGEYWELCFNHDGDRCPRLLMLNIDLENYYQDSNQEHFFHTTISYSDFENIFVRTCIRFIKDFIGTQGD